MYGMVYCLMDGLMQDTMYYTMYDMMCDTMTSQVGNEAEAQVRFQELQHSYAVLSDAHERKWYDDHRDEILNPARYGDGGDDSDGEGGGGRTVNLTKYFR